MDKPLVRMVWNDACDSHDPWISERELDEFASTPALVESVGYLIKKTKTHITIAGDWLDDQKLWGRCTKVPKKMVVSIEMIPFPSPVVPPTDIPEH